MSKYICTACGIKCILTIPDKYDYIPETCLYKLHIKPNWQLLPEEDKDKPCTK